MAALQYSPFTIPLAETLGGTGGTSSSGTLAAIAALTPAAGDIFLVASTGPLVVTKLNLSADVQTLLGKSNLAAMKTYLGIS